MDHCEKVERIQGKRLQIYYVKHFLEYLKINVMDRVQAPKIPAMHAYIIFPDFHLNFHYNDRQRQTMLSVSTLS